MSRTFISVNMNQQQIIEKVRGLKTKLDLLNLLNALKREDLGKECYRFTLNQINFYCNPNNNPSKRYKDFTIPKKSGGVRKISAPIGSLKSILRYLNVIFQAMYEPTEAAMGFVPGRSIADNAAMHVGRNYVFNTDLKDFFPSIHQARIWRILQNKPFSLNVELASVIAGLCCMLDPNGTVDKSGKIIGVLPQGSPCSPILTNIVCRNLDRKLLGLAKRFNLRYTRYADDITFSSDYNVFQEGSEFMKEFTRIIAEQRFKINDSKTRLQKSGQRQEVTGLVVNKKVNVAREYYRDLRSLLYIWKRYGKEQAYAKFCIRYKESKTYKRKKNELPDIVAVVSGKLLYMKMVMGEESTAYLSLRNQFISLCPEQKAILDNNLNYLASYRLDEFEKAFNTKVLFAYKPQNKATGKSKTMGTFNLGDEKHVVAINIRCDSIIDKYLAAPDEKVMMGLRKRLYITLSERASERFWLITIARMNNEHSGSFNEIYKAKLRPKVEIDSCNDIEDMGSVHEILDYDSLPANIDVDGLLSEFVKSEFDFKTLSTWDKIRKS